LWGRYWRGFEEERDEKNSNSGWRAESVKRSSVRHHASRHVHASVCVDDGSTSLL
jgi:hypothetical protein